MARMGDTSVPARPTSLGPIMRDVCRYYGREPSGRILDCGGITGVDRAIVWGDEDHLRQLFTILLDNAVRYTPRGRQVTVSGVASDDCAVITVADEGVGIDAAYLPMIFDRFYRAPADGVTGSVGTGLGLAIARQLAEQHGGRITVESKPGAGSRFTVLLPLSSATTEPIGGLRERED